LVRFETASGAESWGAHSGERGEPTTICDLGRGPHALAPTLLEAMQHWSALSTRIEEVVASAQPVDEPVRLLCPIPVGGKLLCIGLNYRDHAIETGMPIPAEPIVFNKLAGALCGPECVVPLPACSTKVDYEA